MGSSSPGTTPRFTCLRTLCTTVTPSSRASAATPPRTARRSSGLKEHIDRLFDGAKVYRMRLPYTKEQLTLPASTSSRRTVSRIAMCRPIVFSAQGEMGVNPLKNPVMGAIACWEWGAYLGEEGMEKGIRCTVSSWARIDSENPPSAGEVFGELRQLDTGKDRRLGRRLRRGDPAHARRLRRRRLGREHLPGQERRALHARPWSRGYSEASPARRSSR